MGEEGGIVKILVTVEVADGRFKEPNVRLEREVELPFPPTPELTIFSEQWQETVNEVLYDEDEKRYVAKIHRITAHDQEECVTAMLGMGWRKA